MEVTVVGAGVIGLVTALTLEERGHTVRVVAAAYGEATTSAGTGGLRRDRAQPPGGRGDRGGGVRAGRDGDGWPDLGGGVRGSGWRGLGAADEYFVCALFLPYIAARLPAPIERRMVVDLAAEPGDVVVNCTGLGARELAGDATVYPLFGQVVIADPGGVDLAVTISDSRDPDEMFYLIPRRTELVLGGCSRPYPPGAPPELDPDLGARILRQAHALGLQIGAARTERAGLRPYRLEVRLERQGRIIHNYGHGGAGFTLCRGCAETVAQILMTPV